MNETPIQHTIPACDVTSANFLALPKSGAWMATRFALTQISRWGVARIPNVKENSRVYDLAPLTPEEIRRLLALLDGEGIAYEVIG
ncbi:MAG: hypothetical protein FVQ81_17765 [Candidatus Glassbacteria bacterium]|nr:hypothetical protein [Candidatus Glassbacteria bacterium]